MAFIIPTSCFGMHTIIYKGLCSAKNILFIGIQCFSNILSKLVRHRLIIWLAVLIWLAGPACVLWTDYLARSSDHALMPLLANS